jgi:hypothetical protein
MPALRILPQVRSTRQSGRDLAALAADPQFEGISGRYYDGRKPIRSSEESYDRAKALDLWQTSVELAEIDSADPAPRDTDSSPI